MPNIHDTLSDGCAPTDIQYRNLSVLRRISLIPALLAIGLYVPTYVYLYVLHICKSVWVHRKNIIEMEAYIICQYLQFQEIFHPEEHAHQQPPFYKMESVHVQNVGVEVGQPYYTFFLWCVAEVFSVLNVLVYRSAATK